jgi:hypothetical protein
VVALLPLAFSVGCSGASRSTNGALIGGGAGALIGNGLAKAAGGSRTAGTALGGVAGAIGGAVLGDSIDQTERRAEERGRAEAVAYQNAARAPTIDDVISLSRQGVQESVIIGQIRSTNAVYQLTPYDLQRMHSNGVPATVINAMQAGPPPVGRRVYTEVPVQPVTVIERPVYVGPPPPSASVGFHYHSKGRR